MKDLKNDRDRQSGKQRKMERGRVCVSEREREREREREKERERESGRMCCRLICVEKSFFQKFQMRKFCLFELDFDDFGGTEFSVSSEI